MQYIYMCEGLVPGGGDPPPGPGPWAPDPNLAVLGSHFGLKIADLRALKVAKFGRFWV